ncbi:MAG: DUF3365 domain-containing protein [Bacteroidota bacterium]|nr:DUF3365 domain-containing protein [Bacteroidota bacterium]
MRNKIFNTGIALLALSFLFSCNSNHQNRLSQEETAKHLKQGKEIAQSSFKASSSELKAALARGRIEEAISYCNIEAMPITDSLSKAYGVTIRRTGLQARNPENKPTEKEKEILEGYLKLHHRETACRPAVHRIGKDRVLFTAPDHGSASLPEIVTEKWQKRCRKAITSH